jgi:hypothetical protein
VKDEVDRAFGILLEGLEELGRCNLGLCKPMRKYWAPKLRPKFLFKPKTPPGLGSVKPVGSPGPKSVLGMGCSGSSLDPIEKSLDPGMVSYPGRGGPCSSARRRKSPV